MRHRRIVVAAWVVALAALIAAVASVGAQTSDDLTLPGTGSTDATDLLDRYLPEQANGTNPIVLEVTNGKLTDAGNEKVIDRVVDDYKSEPGVEAAVSPLSSRGKDALSKDGRIGYISLTLRDGPDTLTTDRAWRIIDVADPAERAGIEVAAGGYLGQQVSKPETHSSEVVGIAAAIVILLFTFGTAVAMAMPITTAIFGLIIGLCAIALFGHAVEIPTVAPTLGMMIGLGVGIDYALFIVTRHRRGLHDGLDPDESVARACATSGSAVAFAGGTVVIALLSLTLAGIPIVSALGYSAALVVVVAVLCALTLLPTLLSLLGHRIESLAIPALHKPEQRDHKSEFFERMARFVGRHPWSSGIVAIVLLLAIALPALDMRLGQQDYGQFPESTEARQAYDALSRGFGPGVNGPFLIAVRFVPPAHNDQQQLNQLEQQQKQQQQQAEAEANATAQELVAEGVPPDQAQQQAEAEAQPSQKQQQQYDQQKQYLQSDASDPDLVHLQNRIGKAKGVKSVSPAKVDKSGKAAVFNAIPTTGPSAEATSDLVHRLRDQVIPPATKGTGLTAYVGGSTAAYDDLADVISDRLLQVIATVVALSFVLLLIAFRSLLVPLTSAAMNLLSVAAAYGVLTAVFEKGWGVELIGLDHPVPIVSFVPLLMFAILFGLSMDYQVFLVSRIGERYQELGKDNHEAVVEGLATSARVITSAALIMVFVFSSFILNGNPTVKQFGVGMAAAIAIDATIVRCLLVPSVMMLLGRANWWLPGWMERVLPRVGLETEEALPPLPDAEVEPAQPAARV